MIFVFIEAGTLDVADNLEEVRRDCEGVDVESGVYSFYDENGTILEAHFTAPNKRGSFLGLIKWTESGVYELRPNPEADADPIGLALYETSRLNTNRFFKSLDEVRSFLTGRGVSLETHL